MAFGSSKLQSGQLLTIFALAATTALLLTKLRVRPQEPSLAVGQAAPPVEGYSPSVRIEVSANDRSGMRFSPKIFGVNGVEMVGRVPRGTFTLIRLGGNRYSTYNHQTNDSNAGADFQHQNDDYLSPSTEPLAPMRAAIATGVDHLVVTVPMLGWVAADRLANGDVAQSPDYRSTRFVRSCASCVENPPAAQVCQADFVRALLALQQNNHPQIDVELDNEPEGWHRTHARLRGEPGESHPAKLTYAELLSRSIEYATAIRSIGGSVRILGPVGFGFPAFIDLAGAPDAEGRLFLDTYVQTMSARNLLDVLDVHWYPMVTVGGRTVASGSSDADVANLRVQLPRSLYDPSYTEPSWIARDYFRGPIRLLQWLQARSAGRLPTAITEYHYGGGNDISGAVAIADALGAFAFYGVDSAAVWPLTNQEHAFTLAAFRVLRDSFPFQGVALPTRSSAIERVGAWSAEDGNLLHVVLIARAAQTEAVEVRLPRPMRTMAAFAIDAQHAVPFDCAAQVLRHERAAAIVMSQLRRGVVHLVLADGH